MSKQHDIDKLTKKQQERVEVLKDAIKQLQVKSIIAKAHNTFIDLDGTHKDRIRNLSIVLDDDYEFNAFMDKIITPKNPCTVCAKGAIVLSAIRKFNNCSVEDARSLEYGVSARAHNILGQKNADLIEQYFENKYDKLHYDSTKKIDRWAKRYPNDKDRLIAIFKNAIKNKGTFKP